MTLIQRDESHLNPSNFNYKSYILGTGKDFLFNSFPQFPQIRNKSEFSISMRNNKFGAAWLESLFFFNVPIFSNISASFWRIVS